MPGRNNFESGGGGMEASAEEKAHEFAHKHAVMEVGEPAEFKDSDEEDDYWDRYWDAYYRVFDPALERYLMEEHKDDIISAIESLRQMVMAIRGEEPDDKEYAFFDTARSRDELFLYCSRLAEYLHEAKVADLVIADRSARPLYVGVLEYWRAKYKGEKAPNILFMNPKGFLLKDDLRRSDYERMSQDAIYNQDLPEPYARARSMDEVIGEVEEKYTGLMQDKDKKVMIFDTCLHTGGSLFPLKATLDKLGFKDVEVGSINPSDPGSMVRTDFSITRTEPEKGCYPFDRDRMVEKTFDHVYSYPTDDPKKRIMSMELRREIKKIVGDRVRPESE